MQASAPRNLERYDGIAALFPRLVQARLGAIDQIRDNIFAFVVGARNGLGHGSAERELLVIPRRVNARRRFPQLLGEASCAGQRRIRQNEGDRKSTRLNSSHPSISYAVF